MDYALRIVVEKVAISSQEVVKRDTVQSYAMQCPTSIAELGLPFHRMTWWSVSPFSEIPRR